MLNEVINGAIRDSGGEDVKDTCLTVVNTFLSMTLAVNQGTMSRIGAQNQVPVAINEDWTVVSLVIEGLGTIIKALGE